MEQEKIDSSLTLVTYFLRLKEVGFYLLLSMLELIIHSGITLFSTSYAPTLVGKNQTSAVLSCKFFNCLDS
jgi:hypothetical protein